MKNSIVIKELESISESVRVNKTKKQEPFLFKENWVSGNPKCARHTLYLDEKHPYKGYATGVVGNFKR